MKNKKKMSDISGVIFDFLQDTARVNKLTLAEIVGLVEVAKFELVELFEKEGE